ncbi:hypothetical protein SFC27_10755 [Bacillus licheniformis]|uniref:hypothetical protein n=1 Tax=Bacillus TaxID=1386 RepID=UPI000BA7BEBB|nr:hypothetical protein [Bacillus licheniformis]MED1659469.1 hypothetical protein [Bacillus licheniformis]PAC91447.1 hypothetical protein CHH99_16960 [Bacillus licheniformis]PAV34024.1 hypothetical protein CJD29_19590 [Bacillus licheniformis]QGI43791.1 hypothetical protein GII88_11790 [Bacillus licheniformis]WKU32251.1 hypothetical protein Q3B96_19080 [Bacillus licheniformis]
MVLKERGQIDQEFGAEEIADYLRLRGFKPFWRPFRGKHTFWHRLRRYYIALVQFDKPGDKDPLSSKSGFTQLGMDSKGRAEEIMMHLVAYFNGWYRTNKEPFPEEEEWLNLYLEYNENE